MDRQRLHPQVELPGLFHLVGLESDILASYGYIRIILWIDRLIIVAIYGYTVNNSSHLWIPSFKLLPIYGYTVNNTSDLWIYCYY